MPVGSGGCPLGGRVWTGVLISFVLPAPAVDIHGNEAQVEEKGAHELSIKPVRNQWQAINPRSVVLKPVN